MTTKPMDSARLRAVTILVGLSLLCLVSGARADTLFQQLPDYKWGYFSDIPGQQLADRFSPGSSADITTVQWWGGYLTDPNMSDQFTLRFFADDAFGLPGTQLGSFDAGQGGKTDTGLPLVNFDPKVEAFSYSYTLPTPFHVTAGDTYWFSVLNGNTEEWLWATHDQTSQVAIRSTDAGNWSPSFPPSGNEAFALGNQTNVPEPTSMLLVGTGLGGLALAGRRRKCPSGKAV